MRIVGFVGIAEMICQNVGGDGVVTPVEILIGERGTGILHRLIARDDMTTIVLTAIGVNAINGIRNRSV